MKKFLWTLLIILLNSGVIYAGEIAIEITPVNKISTSGNSLMEGDFVDFRVVKDTPKLKKDDIVTGIVTYLDPNGFAGKAAALSLEEFRIKNSNQKIKGGIYIDGSSHNLIMEFKDQLFLPAAYIRGGEITLKPNKHIFMLYLEN